MTPARGELRVRDLGHAYGEGPLRRTVIDGCSLEIQKNRSRRVIV